MREFDQIYRDHLEAVFRYSRRCVGRREIAEEITSEAFLALYRNLESIDRSRLPGWLFAVVKNKAIDYWRRCETEQRYQPAPETGAVNSEAPLENWLLESKGLKPVHRVCLTLRYVHDMDRSEIARHTGLSENQVKGHLQYALQLLRKELVKRSR